MASYAERFLDKCNRDTQAMQWYWNTEWDVTLEADANTKRIAVPVPKAVGAARPILFLDGSHDDYGRHFIIKYDSVTQADKLFDLDENSFVFTESVKVKYTYLTTFNMIPEPFVAYMVAKSALELNAAYQINPNATQVLAAQVGIADARMRKHDMQQEDVNVLNTVEAAAIRGRTLGTSRRIRH